MSSSEILVGRDGHVVTITLNRPDVRNAIGDAGACADIEQALRVLEDNPTVSCIILTGAGKAFSAGVDLKSLAAGKLHVITEEDAPREPVRTLPPCYHPSPIFRGITHVERAYDDWMSERVAAGA